MYSLSRTLIKMASGTFSLEVGKIPARTHISRKACTHRINYLILKALHFEHPFRIIETTEFLPESE